MLEKRVEHSDLVEQHDATPESENQHILATQNVSAVSIIVVERVEQEVLAQETPRSSLEDDQHPTPIDDFLDSISKLVPNHC